MSVEIEPLELGFRRPFTVEVSQTLKIKNPSPRPIAFKVKTTAPKQYCVRPNSGRVEPGAEVEVQVLLQAMRQEPPLDARCKDKFLVQSVSISPDLEFSNISALWHQYDGDKSAIQEKKIKVAWLSAESNHLLAATPTKPAPRDSLNTPQTDGHSFSSPGDESHIADTTALPELSSSSPEPSSERDARPQSSATGSGLASKVKPAYEELESRLRDAEAMIVRLKDGGDSGMRQRKTAARDGDDKGSSSQMAMQQQQAGGGGVPLNIVAAIALFSFLLAYFFF